MADALLRHNIEDKLYFMKDNKVATGIVVTRNYFSSRSNGCGKRKYGMSPVTAGRGNSEDGLIEVHEHDVFPSKKELLASL